MDENKVREIIREEFRTFLGSDRYIFSKHIQILDGGNVQVATGTGTKIGTASGQKLGFFGATPVDRPGQAEDLRQALIDLGLYTTGGNSPLNLNGGSFRGQNLQIDSGGSIYTDTVTGMKIGTATDQKIGFYNTTPTAQLTGVAVSAAGIHAALVTLGLITA